MKSTESKTTTAAKTHHSGQAPFFQPGESKAVLDGEHQFFGGSPAPLFQPKLTIGAPDDPYEREADATAEKVVQRLAQPDEPTLSEPAPGIQRMPAPVQRACAECENEEKLQKKEDEEVIQEKVQRKPIFDAPKDGEAPVQRKAETSGVASAPANFSAQLQSSKGGGAPLPAEVNNSMSQAMGADFSGVRVHTGSEAAEMSQSIQAQAFTHGSDIYFNEGKYDTGSMEGQKLLAHELTHVGQQGGAEVIKRSALDSTITEEYARNQSSESLENEINQLRDLLLNSTESNESNNVLQNNLIILEREFANRNLQELRQSESPFFDPSSIQFINFQNSSSSLRGLNASPIEDPLGISTPPGHVIAIDEFGNIEFVNADFSIIDDNLIETLDGVVSSVDGNPFPSSLINNPIEQAFVWGDNRALILPGLSLGIPEIINQGQPNYLSDASTITHIDNPWQRVRDSSLHGLYGTGLHQFANFPLSRFNGVSLPAGTRIRFADAFHQTGTRFLTIFRNNKYYAWDAHFPMPGAQGSAAIAPFYHVNQSGMHALFGQSDHSALTASQLRQARGLRVLRIGGRVFLLVGIAVDSYLLTSAAIESYERGTPRPVVAQAVRTIGGWGGGWAGMQAGCVAGAVAGIETGPGLVLTCIFGGAVGGFAGYYGADWIADMINED